MRQQAKFASAIYIGNRRFWRKGDLRKYINELAGLPPPPPATDDDHMLNSRQVRDFFGGVSHMWLHRRCTEAGHPMAPQPGLSTHPRPQRR
jgi:hypothetical protein